VDGRVPRVRILIVHALSSITSSAVLAASITSPTVLVVLDDLLPHRRFDDDAMDLAREIQNLRLQPSAPRRHSSFPAEPTYPLRLPAPRLPPAMPRLRRTQDRGS